MPHVRGGGTEVDVEGELHGIAQAPLVCLWSRYPWSRLLNDRLASDLQPDRHFTGWSASMTIGQADEDGLPPSMLNRVGYLLYRVGAEATARADAELRKMDLTARQVGILTLVIERRPMSQRELGAKLGVDRTTMVGLLDKLEEHGLVERRRSPEDRRVFLIQPTARGERIHRRAIQVLQECDRTYLKPLSAAERRLIGELLRRIEPELH